ncbi:MAG TPA: (2Fe-2S) ferredoxin domain-containing protein [Firmicutes bacterium]|nr:(2Fe-2S) ferredoxin domain-containing protein [Bacillota bacterium]
MASDPLERLYQLRDDARRSIEARRSGRAGPEVLVGTATCGMAAGATQVLDALKHAIESRGLGNIALGEVGCVGRCIKEPLVEVVLPGRPPVYYENVSPDSAGPRAISCHGWVEEGESHAKTHRSIHRCTGSCCFFTWGMRCQL